MGARTQVVIKQNPHDVMLYSHWGSAKIWDLVKEVVGRGHRLNDEEYLARIIFDEMTVGATGNTTGFGIGSGLHGDLDNHVVVDCKKQVIEYHQFNHDKVLMTEKFENL